MKKVIAISTLVTAVILGCGSNTAHAEASKEENIGFATGALTGAAVGGPVGFIVGAVAGVLIGDEVEQANKLEGVEAQLANTVASNQKLEKELAMIQETIEYEKTAGIEADWLTEGLTMNVMFTTDSSALSDADVASIRKLSDVLNEFPGLKIKLDGYSDPRGSKKHNFILSQNRVSAVKNAFEKFGITADRLITTAHGEIDNVGMNDDLDAYAMARKVSVNFTSQNIGKVAQN